MPNGAGDVGRVTALLTARDVAARLGVSENTAREIMRRTGALVAIGKNGRKRLRLPERALERYIRAGGDICESVCTGAAGSGGAGGTTSGGDGGKQPPTRPTTKPARLSLVVSRGSDRLLKPITPRTSR